MSFFLNIKFIFIYIYICFFLFLELLVSLSFWIFQRPNLSVLSSLNPNINPILDYILSGRIKICGRMRPLGPGSSGKGMK